MKQNKEYQAFNDLLGKVSSVSHDEVKAKLDAEKRAKKKPSKKRASVRASSGKG